MSPHPPALTTDDCLREECVLARSYTTGMQAAQGLELALGTLVVRHRLATSPGFWLRASDSPASLDRRLRKLIVGGAQHPMTNATASELRTFLTDEGIEFPDGLMEQVGRAITARNYLAHRFLREHAANRPAFDMMAAIHRATELQTLLTDTMVAVQKVGDRYSTFVPGTPGEGEIPLPLVDDLMPIILDAVEAMLHGSKPAVDKRLTQFTDRVIAVRDQASGRLAPTI